MAEREAPYSIRLKAGKGLIFFILVIVCHCYPLNLIRINYFNTMYTPQVPYTEPDNATDAPPKGRS
jgi:hypothetical protein